MFLKHVDRLVGFFVSHLLPRPKKTISTQWNFERILFIRPGGIGDAVHIIPVIKAFKQSYPFAKIDILAEKRNSQVFGLCPQVDQVFLYDQPSEFVSIFSRRYDVVIDSEQWHRLSAIVARLIRSRCKIGFATNDRKRMFTHGLEYSHDDYEMESFSNLLSPLGISCRVDFSKPFLEVPSFARQQADRLLAPLTNSFVVLFPGASIPERRWSINGFRLLARRLLDVGLNVVVVGGGEDREVGEAIVKEGGLNLAGSTSLLETCAILEKCTLLVSGDSGVLHLAVGLGKPTVSLFGPGIANKWAPHGPRHRIINRQLECSPCTRFGTTPRCSVQARCIKDITVDEVWAAIENLLGLCVPTCPGGSESSLVLSR